MKITVDQTDHGSLLLFTVLCVNNVLHVKWFLLWLNYNFSLIWSMQLLRILHGLMIKERNWTIICSPTFRLNFSLGQMGHWSSILAGVLVLMWSLGPGRVKLDVTHQWTSAMAVPFLSYCTRLSSSFTSSFSNGVSPLQDTMFHSIQHLFNSVKMDTGPLTLVKNH